MSRRHGRRRHVRTGACDFKGMAFTSWDAAMAAVVRVDAERPYPCDQCGFLHITRYTEAEYAQRRADEGCTDGAIRGMLDLSGPEYLARLDALNEARNASRQSAAGQSDAGEASVERSESSRLAPSPAAVARRLEARSGA